MISVYERISSVIIATLVGLAIAGCASQGGPAKTSAKDAAAAFSKVVTTGADIVRSEAKEKVSVRRDEAILHYLLNGDDPNNITRGGDPRSFANYVCAGSGALQRETSALAFASNYAKSVEGLATPAGDSFAEQWARHLELKGPGPDLKEPEKGKSASERFAECFAEVSALLPNKGVPASDVSDEVAIAGVFAAIDAGKALIDALKKLATRGLTVANEAQARKRLQEFVNANNERVAVVLGTDLRPTKLLEAWNRRKTRALIRPYYAFSHMINEINPKTNPLDVVEMAAVISVQLQEYDALRTMNSPDKVVASIAQAQKALVEAVNREASEGTLFVFLKALLSDLDGLKSDYDDAAKKADEAVKAFRNLKS